VQATFFSPQFFFRVLRHDVVNNFLAAATYMLSSFRCFSAYIETDSHKHRTGINTQANQLERRDKSKQPVSMLPSSSMVEERARYDSDVLLVCALRSSSWEPEDR
jgi:hypothetical protein